MDIWNPTESNCLSETDCSQAMVDKDGGEWDVTGMDSLVNLNIQPTANEQCIRLTSNGGTLEEQQCHAERRPVCLLDCDQTTTTTSTTTTTTTTSTTSTTTTSTTVTTTTTEATCEVPSPLPDHLTMTVLGGGSSPYPPDTDIQ